MAVLSQLQRWPMVQSFVVSSIFPAHLGQWDLHDLFKRMVVALAQLSLEPGVGADSVTSTRPSKTKLRACSQNCGPPSLLLYRQ